MVYMFLTVVHNCVYGLLVSFRVFVDQPPYFKPEPRKLDYNSEYGGSYEFDEL